MKFTEREMGYIIERLKEEHTGLDEHVTRKGYELAARQEAGRELKFITGQD